MNTFGSISQRTAAWAAIEMLAHAMPIECAALFALNKEIPANTSDNAKWRRAIPFPPALTPLAEGVTPAGRAMQYEDVSATLMQLGDYVEITDKVQDMSEDPVLKDATSLCGEQAAETIETLLWGVMKGGTAMAQTNGGTTRASINTALTGSTGLSLIRNATRTLKAQRARTIKEMMRGSPDYGTSPVGAAFFGFGHTDFETDLRGITGFVPVENYGQSLKAVPYEVGKVESVRFVLSPVFTPAYAAGAAIGGSGMKTAGGVNVDVYSMVIVGKEAYGNVALRGKKAMTPMVLNPGVPRGGDPLGQRGSVGWKTYWAGLILNQTWAYRLDAGVTA